MTPQLTIDYCTTKQNSPANQAILEAKKPELNNQSKVLLQVLKRGGRLMVADGFKGLWDMDEKRHVFIGDLRARIRDLRKAGYDIKDEKTNGNYKIYHL